jgi:hypothetical protein
MLKNVKKPSANGFSDFMAKNKKARSSSNL